MEIHKLSPHDDLQRLLKTRAVQLQNYLAQVRFLLFVDLKIYREAVSSSPGTLAHDHICQLQPVLTSERDRLYLPFPICLVGGVCNFSDFELSRPFTGLMMISSAPLRNALGTL